MSETLATVKESTLTAIADAIRAKDGSTDTMLPSEMAAKIEAIPVKTKYHPMRGQYDEEKGREGTKIVIEVEAGDRFYLNRVKKHPSSDSVTINWGDGTVETTTGWDQGGHADYTTGVGFHVYASAGEYTVTVSDDATMVSVRGYNYINGRTDQYIEYGQKKSNRMVRAVLQWGTKITDCSNAFLCCYNLEAFPCWNNVSTSSAFTYAYCVSLRGEVPSWNSVTTTANSTYYTCAGLSGEIPEWGGRIANAYATFYGCARLCGDVPEWNNEIVNAYHTYAYCYGLSGGIPSWGSKVTNACGTYTYCFGLTGSIPAWANTITNANNTYAYCGGLTGVIPVWGSSITSAYETYYCNGMLTGVWSDEATDDELMPSRITSFSRCVASTADPLRAKFLTSWGGTRAS